MLFLEDVNSQPSSINDEGNIHSSPLKIISDNDEGLLLSYNSGDIEFERLKPEEGYFIRLKLPDHSFSSDPGKPQLPVVTRLIDYNKAKNARIIIKDVVIIRKYLEELGDYNIIYPSQPGQTKNTLPQDNPLVIDKSVYNSPHAYIRDTVAIKEIGIMRGQSIASLDINPVIYNPSGKYIDIISSMKIYIKY